MSKVLILYYSGVGNTKHVSGFLHSTLAKEHFVEVHSVEKMPRDLEIDTYDALILGFPTIHVSPARPMIVFVNKLQRLKEEIPTFLFTTCGLYSENTLRILAKKCIPLNIIPILCKSYRCSAIDGVLLAPFMKCWFKHERNLDAKVETDVLCFMEQIGSPIKYRVPRVKLYSLINYPNKWFGRKYIFSIYLHENQCNACGKCMKNCSEEACSKGDDGFPIIQKSKCINCYRCIHHCPKSALSLSKKHLSRKTLYTIYGEITPTQ